MPIELSIIPSAAALAPPPGAAARYAIGLPKGRFTARTRAVLEAGGATWDDRLRFELSAWRATVYILKASDMPRAVADGLVDLAIVPEEWVLEHEADRSGGIARLGTFSGWLETRLSFFAAPGATWPPARGTRIATCFPALARSLLQPTGVEPRILQVAGSTEAFVGTLADYGFDCVETGGTLARNGLAEIFCAAPKLGMVAISAEAQAGSSRRLLPKLRAAVAASRAA